MKWVYDDGGRSQYFKADGVGDCVTRAIAIATGKDYKEVYDEINARGNQETSTQLKKHKGGKKSTARNGVFKETFKAYLADLGWKHHSTCAIGKGVTCHLNADELPSGTIIVQIAKHLVCVKDGVLHDTYDSSVSEYYDIGGNLVRNENRAVYGYWTKPEEIKIKIHDYLDALFYKESWIGTHKVDRLEAYRELEEFIRKHTDLNKEYKEIERMLTI